MDTLGLDRPSLLTQSNPLLAEELGHCYTKGWGQSKSCKWLGSLRSGSFRRSQLLSAGHAYHRVTGDAQRTLLCDIPLGVFILEDAKCRYLNSVSRTALSALTKCPLWTKYYWKRNSQSKERIMEVNTQYTASRCLPPEHQGYPPSIASDSNLMRQPLQEQCDFKLPQCQEGDVLIWIYKYWCLWNGLSPIMNK